MHRTTIMLPRALKAKALKRAKAAGVSLGELIRQSLVVLLGESRPRRGDADPLLGDKAVFKGSAPRDLAGRHDDYLYREAGDLR